MADDKTNAAEYWKANVRLIFGCLAVWAFVSYGCAILFRPLLAGIPVGGTDLGPNPYQFLAAGLGACTTMTIRMYARRKGIPLAHVAVDVTHNKSHIQDCKDCEKPDQKTDVFRRAIRLEGEMSADQRASLLAIADKCPVHRTLSQRSVIETVAA